MQIALSVSRKSVYVGQEVPVTVRWSFFADDMTAVQYAFSNLQIRSPLFDQFTFKDQPQQSRTSLIIATAKGGMEVDCEGDSGGTERATMRCGLRHGDVGPRHAREIRRDSHHLPH